MGTTITLPAILTALQNNCGCTSEEAADFIHALTDTIIDGLMSAACVTVKGVGEFRVVDTGAEKTVAYLPDTELAQDVNSPFSLFEPVNLSEGVTEAMLDEFYEAEKAGADSEGSAAVPETNESSAVPVRDDVEVEVTDNLSDMSADNPAKLPAGLPPVPGAAEISDEAPGAYPVVGQPKSTERTGLSEESSAANVSANSGALEGRVSVENIAPVLPSRVAPEKDEDVSENISRERRPRRRRKETVIIVLIGLLSLLAGVFAGHFGIPGLNINGVKSVKITAEEVTLLHEKPSNDDLTAGMPGTKDTVPTKDNLPDTVEPAQSVIDAAPPRPVASPVVTDTVQGTNYLSRIARRHYGKDIFWVYIYEENKDKIQDPNNINPGTVVVIPPAEKYGIDPSNSASINNAERLSAKILNKES